MNAIIDMHMAELSELGYSTEDIRSTVKLLAESELTSRCYLIRKEIKSNMEKMTIEELTAIIEKMQKGGKQ